MDCGFPARALMEHLRDRFLLGMAGELERDRTINVKELTLEKALRRTESVGCAREGARHTR